MLLGVVRPETKTKRKAPPESDEQSQRERALFQRGARPLFRGARIYGREVGGREVECVRVVPTPICAGYCFWFCGLDPLRSRGHDESLPRVAAGAGTGVLGVDSEL